MGQSDAVEYVNINDQPSSPGVHGTKKVSILPLIFLIFYEVSGGPFGVEDSVKAAGPLLALLGFLVFTIIWSVPEALITAEMGTVFPENCVLFLDYFKSGIPALGDGLPRAFAVLALTFVLTFMNYRGLTIVGWAAVLLGIFSLLPFVVMGLVSLPKLEPSRWLVLNLGEVDWNLYLNTLFWNINYWDSISTLAGEVDNSSVLGLLLYLSVTRQARVFNYNSQASKRHLVEVVLAII
ncbi:polyamine transporter RMV1 [Citrus sinensis]|uniref:Polyamine transporter RMV1 n=1 Tax=Citrus sinensis TaxID=2711 RepID=A0ACB8KHA5_CITSI|nr:polyamine transporter RMV1 [Citrus sinensis]